MPPCSQWRCSPTTTPASRKNSPSSAKTKAPPSNPPRCLPSIPLTDSMSPIPLHAPHCVVGVIGGGQLGRMIALAARRMGVRTVIWTGGLEAPAVEVADEVIDLPFDDPAALADFCSRVTVSNVEFENIHLENLKE